MNIRKKNNNIYNRAMKKCRKYMIAILVTVCCIFSACGNEADTEAADTAAADRVEENPAEEETAAFDPESVTSFIPSDKEEIVSVRADAYGNPEKIEVSGTLSGFADETGSYLKDVSGLSELKNARGEENYFVSDDGTVYWENLGEDIQYEGLSDRELPVNVKVTYYLNGKEQSLEKMKGKSGEVRIRFDYENKVSRSTKLGDTEQDMAVPFLAVSMAVLPEDTFHDVEISKGKVMMISGQRAAVGYALPGLQEDLNLAAHEQTEDIDLPDYVEITAQTDDFSLDFTATILTAGLFRDMDDEKLSDFDDTVKDMDELKDGVNDLEEAAGELADGTAEMQTYLSQYVSGVNSVAEAVGQINTSLSAFDLTKLSQLSTALDQAAGAAGMSTALRQAAGLSALSDTLTQVSQLSALADPLEQTAGLSDLGDALAGAAGLGELAGSLQNLSNLNTLAAQLQAAAQEQPECAELQELAGWAGALQEMAGIADRAPQLQQAAALSGYADTLRQASGLANYADPVRSLAGLSEGADALSQLSGLTELADGLDQLSALSDAAEGVTQLQTGVEQLKDGVSQLDQGTSQLPAAGKALNDGMTELHKGTVEFRDGIKDFNEDGIDELIDFVKGDMKDLIDRIRAVKEADLAYNGYTASLKGQEVSSVFLIETDGTE